MHAVGDHRDVDALVQERDADERGCLMVQRGHRIEDAGDQARAGVDCSAGDLAAGAGVAERDGDAALAEPCDGSRRLVGDRQRKLGG